MVERLAEPTVLLSGRSMVESGRWHEGRWWFADWGTGEVVALDPHGRAEVVAQGPPPPRMGWAIAWLPDGRLLTSGDALTVHERDGGSATYWDHKAGEIAVDPAGHVFVNGFDRDFAGGGGAKPDPGWIHLVGSDGTSRQVAGELDFPNGMVVTPDGSTLVVSESMAGRLTAFDIEADGSLTGRRVWAEHLGPDGIGIDDDAGIWVQTADVTAHTGDPDDPAGACVRVLEGGEVTHRVETDEPCLSVTVGGVDGRQLMLLCNHFEGVEKMVEVQARWLARVLVTDAPVPAAAT